MWSDNESDTKTVLQASIHKVVSALVCCVDGVCNWRIHIEPELFLLRTFYVKSVPRVLV